MKPPCSGGASPFSPPWRQRLELAWTESLSQMWSKIAARAGCDLSVIKVFFGLLKSQTYWKTQSACAPCWSRRWKWVDDMFLINMVDFCGTTSVDDMMVDQLYAIWSMDQSDRYQYGLVWTLNIKLSGFVLHSCSHLNTSFSSLFSGRWSLAKYSLKGELSWTFLPKLWWWSWLLTRKKMTIEMILNLSRRLSIGRRLSCSASHAWDLVSYHRLGLKGGNIIDWAGREGEFHLIYNLWLFANHWLGLI